MAAPCGGSFPVSGDYRSFGSGSWNVLATWAQYDGASWNSPVAVVPDISAAKTTVCSGHTVTVPTSALQDLGGIAVNEGTISGGNLNSVLRFQGSSFTNDGSVEVLKFRFSGPGAIWDGTGTWSNNVVEVQENTFLGSSVTVAANLTITGGDTLLLDSDTLTMDGSSGLVTLSNGGAIEGPGEIRTLGSVRLSGAGAWNASLRVVNGITEPLIFGLQLSGDVVVEPGATLKVRSSLTLFVAANLTNNGKITGGNTSSLLQFTGSTLTNNDTVEVTRFWFSGTAQLWQGAGTWINDEIRIRNLSNTTLGNDMTLKTDLDVDAGGTLTLGTDTLTMDGSSGLVILRNAGTITNPGEIHLEGSVALYFAGAWNAPLRVVNGTTELLTFGLQLSGDVVVEPGATLKVGSSRTLVVAANLTNNGKITGGNTLSLLQFTGSTLTNNDTVEVTRFWFQGATSQILGGDGTGVFEKFDVSLSDTVSLVADQSVYGALTMTQGFLNLSGGSIDLGATGSVVSEAGTKRILGTGGTLSATATLSAPSAVNPGNLGVVITSSADLGVTTVVRGHSEQIAAGPNGSVLRYFDITPANNSGLNATLVLKYFDEELNGVAESDLQAYRSPDGGTSWTVAGGAINTSLNTVTLTSVDSFSRWTLGGLIGFLPVSVANAKVFLEGPYSGSLMSTALAIAGDVPLSQPYDATIFSGTTREYDSLLSVSTLPANTVDWVLLTLRTGTSSATSVDTALAFVLSDGSLVDTAGSTVIPFFNAPADSLYLVIRHRNHLGVMSSSKLDYTSGSTGTWDFTTGLGQAYTTGPAPMVSLPGGVFGMFGGDYSADEQVTAIDFNGWLVDTKAIVTGYVQTDGGFDGQVTAVDFNLWLTNTKAVAASRVP